MGTLDGRKIGLIGLGLMGKPMARNLAAEGAQMTVASRSPGPVDELVADGSSGYVVEPGNASQLADRFVQLIQNPVAARSMGAAGRACVVRYWSVERMVSGYEALITRIYRSKFTATSSAPVGSIG